MLGELAFLEAGRLAVAASQRGDLLVRVDAPTANHLLETTNARPMQMKGRAVRGWPHVGRDNQRHELQLAKSIAIGTSTASSLPTKG